MKTLKLLHLAWVVVAAISLAAQPQKARLPLSFPFDFANNQVFLKVGINNASPVWFILDSGASANVIDAALAQKLALKTEGEKQGTGAGKGTVRVTFAKNVDFKLPGLSVPAESVYIIDLSGQPALQGREVGGILGYDFFLPYIVDVDYEAGVLTLHDLATYKYAGSGQELPFNFVKKVPHIKIKVKIAGREPVESDVLVDQGSGDAVDVDLMAESPNKLEVVGGVGLGQEFRTTVGRAEAAQIAGYTLKGPVGVSGGVPLIGNEVLRRFHVIFDYSRQKLYLEPNAHFDDEFLVDSSGLDLRWATDFKTFIVHDVAAQSPAAEVGIKTGDLITSINDRAAADFTIEQVNKMLLRASARYRLGIKRGSQRSEIVIKLRKRL